MIDAPTPCRAAYQHHCRHGNQPRIFVVGSTVMDLIAYTARLPHALESVEGDDIQLGFGGKGARQAVTARLLGAEVAIVNAFGDDVFGDRTSTDPRHPASKRRPRARAGRSSGSASNWAARTSRDWSQFCWP